MNTSRIALIAAVTGLLAWAGKAVTIGVTGLDAGPAEALFLVGLAAQLSAVVALGLAFTTGRRLGVRLAAAVAAPVVVAVLTLLVNLVIERARPANPSWVWGEINLWVMAVVVLGLAIVAGRRSYAGRPTSRAYASAAG